jgi:hypothetical protein
MPLLDVLAAPRRCTASSATTRAGAGGTSGEVIQGYELKLLDDNDVA